MGGGKDRNTPRNEIKALGIFNGKHSLIIPWKKHHYPLGPIHI